MTESSARRKELTLSSFTVSRTQIVITHLLRMYQTPVSAPASQEPDRSHAVRYKAITYTAWSENTV